MITALDSSVVLAIAKNEPSAKTWTERLAGLRSTGQLIAGETVWAETRAFFHSRPAHASAMDALGISFLPMNAAAASLAGEIYVEYRRAGGTRLRMISDFLIGAHALTQASQLAAADTVFFRQYFQGLKIVET